MGLVLSALTGAAFGTGVIVGLCCRGFLGSLSLRLSKGSSGRCGRASAPTPEAREEQTMRPARKA